MSRPPTIREHRDQEEEVPPAGDCDREIVDRWGDREDEVTGVEELPPEEAVALLEEEDR